jgi:H+/Cl- antiporter ClcA
MILNLLCCVLAVGTVGVVDYVNPPTATRWLVLSLCSVGTIFVAQAMIWFWAVMTKFPMIRAGEDKVKKSQEWAKMTPLLRFCFMLPICLLLGIIASDILSSGPIWALHNLHLGSIITSVIVATFFAFLRWR